MQLRNITALRGVLQEMSMSLSESVDISDFKD